MSTTFKNIVNRFNTTIKAASSINNTDDPVTFNITDATGIPAVPFYFTVEQLTDSSVFERMLATAVDGDEIVATRAQDGSSKQTFAAGDLVQIRVIAAHIDEATSAINAVEDNAIMKASFTKNSSVLVGTGAGTFTEEDGATLKTSLGLTIGSDVQAWDASLDSIAALTYVSGSFIALTAEDTYVVRTYAQVLSDIGAAAVAQTFYIGTTQVAINRGSATLNLSGIGTLACGAITSSGNIKANTNNYVLEGSTSRAVLRKIYLVIQNGTNANTLKCTVGNRWNGDTIAVTDNIAKDATTGNFSLSVNGTALWIEAAGLSGNCIMAMGVVVDNASAVDLTIETRAISNDLYIYRLRNATTGVDQDITTLVDTGDIILHILYMTDA